MRIPLENKRTLSNYKIQSMCHFIAKIIVYIIVELLANLIFFNYLKKKYGSTQLEHEKTTPWIKGVLERACLNAGLILGYPQILIAFGALKIGTKINNESINSEYYLLGNLASILTCFISIYLIKQSGLIIWLGNVFGCI